MQLRSRLQRWLVQHIVSAYSAALNELWEPKLPLLRVRLAILRRLFDLVFEQAVRLGLIGGRRSHEREERQASVNKALLNEIRQLHSVLMEIADFDFACGPQGCGLHRTEGMARDALKSSIKRIDDLLNVLREAATN
ncbi:MAG TPA: hypothetical protein VGJ20_30715 [Xanthobacteraceae bacterium]|jgi:hypothetical protein